MAIYEPTCRKLGPSTFRRAQDVRGAYDATPTKSGAKCALVVTMFPLGLLLHGTYNQMHCRRGISLRVYQKPVMRVNPLLACQCAGVRRGVPEPLTVSPRLQTLP